MSDQHQLKHLRFIRKAFVNSMDVLSNEQLNQIPEGFKNNIIWNLAHSICSTQSMCYGAAGQDIGIPKDMRAKYKNGTSPEGNASDEEIKYWKELAISTIGQLEQDMDARLFNTYRAWDLSRNNNISSVEDALEFCYFHEGSHFGYMLALRKLV